LSSEINKESIKPVTLKPVEPVIKETVTFTINDKEITVPKGTTVMTAAKQNDVYIPHFCWHPGLSVAGVCRFCMVKVEGRPKLEIGCNLTATPGMKVLTLTPEVKEAHKWALEFHLINHPLDCPICDQAGECKLQDYYMEVGQYKSQMERPKVLKPKAIEVGDDLVLDTERCILCDRCVRFEAEVTKTAALGIFNRGDRAVIGTYPGKKISHQYQTNIVDICPVGAFTSKDFRFKQRVWFLKHKPTICPGCSTGCHVDVYGKPDTRTYYRIKPRESEVNQFWMCDTGRKTYKHLNLENRLRGAITSNAMRKRATLEEAYQVLAEKIKAAKVEDLALLVAPQYTCEEYQKFFEFFVSKLKITKVFEWREPTEDRKAFDGILYRGDKNPNSWGLRQALEEQGLVKPGQEVPGFNDVAASGATCVIALAPEILFQFPSLKSQLALLEEISFVSLWTTSADLASSKKIKHALPMKGFAEKTGTFLNFEGKVGLLQEAFPSAVEDARDVSETVISLGEVLMGLS
jgi:NADH-quinone oxidoreductase subunit G